MFLNLVNTFFVHTVQSCAMQYLFKQYFFEANVVR